MDAKTVAQVFMFQRGYLGMLVDDIPDAQLANQPGGIVNHPAWQIGHLASAADNACELLGGTKRLDQAWSDMYGMGSKPLPSRSAYPSKAELLAILDERRGMVAALMNQATDAFLNQANPSPVLSPVLPTRAHAATMLMLFHEGTHMGQLAMWRRAAGMVEALSKFAR